MERKPCPYCGEEIASNAKKCRFCGEWLETSASSDNNNYLEEPRILNQTDSSANNNSPTDYSAYFQDTGGSLVYSGVLYFLIAICILGTILEIIMTPTILGLDGRDMIPLSNLGCVMSSVSEIVILFLVAHKIYKENINRLSYFLLVSYACIIALTAIFSLISENTSIIFSIVGLIAAIILGCILLKVMETRKIGLWLILSVIGGVLMTLVMTLVISMQSDNLNEKLIIFISLLYIIPYYQYLTYCKGYLTSA